MQIKYSFIDKKDNPPGTNASGLTQARFVIFIIQYTILSLHENSHFIFSSKHSKKHLLHGNYLKTKLILVYVTFHGYGNENRSFEKFLYLTSFKLKQVTRLTLSIQSLSVRCFAIIASPSVIGVLISLTILIKISIIIIKLIKIL